MTCRRQRHNGVKALKTWPLTTGTAESVCTRINGVQMSVRKLTGTARAKDATGEVVYTPPEGEARIRDLLANRERFLREEESLDPSVRTGILTVVAVSRIESSLMIFLVSFTIFISSLV